MSELTLVIGNKNYSSWSLRPWLLFKHFQIVFKEKNIALYTNTFEEKLEEYGSDYKVPVLLDNDLVIWDSLAIMDYVSEKYLDNKAWPGDISARATARSVSAEMHSSFTNVRNEMPMNCRRTPSPINLSTEAKREINRIQSIWQKCRSEFDNKGNWLFGEYSIADAMYAPIVLRFNAYKVPLEGLAKTYSEHVLKEPYIQEWIEAGKMEEQVISEFEI